MVSSARLARLRHVVEAEIDAVADANPPQQSPPHEPRESQEHRFVWKQGVSSSYNLGAVPKLPALSTVKLPPSDLNKGDLAPVQQSFTPILALAKFPYRWCDQNHKQDIASQFFDGGKFWNREWDLYYVWQLDSLGTKPVVLVRESQFQQLLNEINAAMKLGLNITNSHREEGLTCRFPNHPRCRPRYLGRSYSRDEHDKLVSQAPALAFQAPGEPVAAALTGNALDDFEQMMEEVVEIQKGKTKSYKQKKKLERLSKQRTMADMFKRTQRYLGLRGQTGNAPAIDVSQPVSLPSEPPVVFISVDVESYERAHDKVTEIGISSITTRDLAGIPPGKDGENWRPRIQARHFRIQEHRHLQNSEFVSGCADRFDYGTSEFISLKDAARAVAACFKPPFCAVPDQSIPTADEKFNIVLCGHDTLTDVRYLQQVGFDPLQQPTIVESVDSSTLFKFWRREDQPTRLGNILSFFDIDAWNLHNAGNDAVFTLQAMLATCVREATMRTPEL